MELLGESQGKAYGNYFYRIFFYSVAEKILTTEYKILFLNLCKFFTIQVCEPFTISKIELLLMYLFVTCNLFSNIK